MLDDDGFFSLSHCWLALERGTEERGLREPSMRMYAEVDVLGDDVMCAEQLMVGAGKWNRRAWILRLECMLK